jgi:hypothetical protein
MLLKLINPLYTVNMNEILIVVLRWKTVLKYRITQQDVFLEENKLYLFYSQKMS